MNLESVRQKRVSLHQKKMMRYLKYVFNDHFVIVLLFLLGAAGYFYSDFLKQASSISWFLQVFGVVILTVTLLVGELATLVEPADTVFLTPLENSMYEYVTKMKRRSLALPYLLELGVVAAVMPLFVAGNSLRFGDTFFLVASAWLLKATDLDMKLLSFTYQKGAIIKYWDVILVLCGFGVFLSSLFLPAVSGLLLASTFFIIIKAYTKKQVGIHVWDWEKMVAFETTRLSGHYRLLNLFTDVPVVATPIKKSVLFEAAGSFLFSIRLFDKKNANKTYDFLFQRIVMRNPDYRNLYVRLLILSFVGQLYSPAFFISVGLAIVFLYAIGFQLLPLFTHFKGNDSASLYPVRVEDKQRSLARVIGPLLFVMVLVQSAAGFIALGLQLGSLLIGAQSAFCVFFLTQTLPKRTKSM